MTGGAPAGTHGAGAVKQCCARLYESDLVKTLLGDSFHPGGLALTERLGQLLGLTRAHRVLDAASGTGATALFLADRFGCDVVGVDYGAANVARATEATGRRGLAHRVRFQQADAESLPLASGTFDAVICECAFCTFPDRHAAAQEFRRVLRPGGCVGLSDVTRAPESDDALSGLLARIACLAEAQPVAGYQSALERAGFTCARSEAHDAALSALVSQIQGRLLAAEVLAGLKTLDLSGVDFDVARRLARTALEEIQGGRLGYAIVHATAP